MIIFQCRHKYLNFISESELAFVSLFHFTLINLLVKQLQKENLDILQCVPLFQIYQCQKGCHRSKIIGMVNGKCRTLKESETSNDFSGRA